MLLFISYCSFHYTVEFADFTITVCELYSIGASCTLHAINRN